MKRIIVMLFVVLGLSPISNAQEQKKNVLFIIADDLNCNISSYGHYMVKTPNIDKLADQGLLFNNAYTNFPLCGPSRASFMTGLYPNQTNLKDLNTLVRDRVPDVTTMSQNFMNNGYISARVGKLYHAGNPKEIGTSGHDDPQSWNITINPKGRDKDEEDKIFSLTRSFGASLSWLAADGTDEEQTDGKVATEAINLLQQFADDSKPFFLGIGFYKPHTPFVAPKKYFGMYPKDSIKVPYTPQGYLQTLPDPAQRILTRIKAQNNLSDSLARCAIQGYYAAVSFLDAQVGRVLNAVDSLGLRDNTIIVFTSDHGYHLGEHGYYQKMTLFENSDQMPLIISYPDQNNKGQVTNSLVEMIDFYPTLSELAGISYPDYISGKSMVPILENTNAVIRENAFSQIDNAYMTKFKNPTYGYTIRTCQYRYTRWEEGGEGMIELYNRANDPGEMINLANDSRYENIMQQLDVELQKRIDESSEKPQGITVLKTEKELRK